MTNRSTQGWSSFFFVFSDSRNTNSRRKKKKKKNTRGMEEAIIKQARLARRPVIHRPTHKLKEYDDTIKLYFI
jgi:hypothetical protein